MRGMNKIKVLTVPVCLLWGEDLKHVDGAAAMRSLEDHGWVYTEFLSNAVRILVFCSDQKIVMPNLKYLTRASASQLHPWNQ